MATVKISDGELDYDEQGTGPPVVLVHGGALDRRMWDGQVGALAASHRVVRYDSRGHGRSSTPRGDFSPYGDLGELLDALELDSAALMGLSFGARTVLDFALAHPERVDRVVAASPGLSGLRFADPFILELFGVQADAMAAGDIGGAVEGFLRQWVDGPNRAPGDVAPDVREACRSMAAETFERHTGGTGGFAHYGAADRLGELSVPTLAIVGELDSSDVLVVHDLLGEHVPEAKRLVFPGCGHMVNLERPAEFNAAVLDFLNA